MALLKTVSQLILNKNAVIFVKQVIKIIVPGETNSRLLKLLMNRFILPCCYFLQF